MRMHRIVAIIAVVLVVSSLRAQESRTVIGVYGQGEQFTLKQAVDNVSEKGMLYGAGLTLWQLQDSGLELDALAELFTGTADHSGDTRTRGTQFADKNQSKYGGCKLEALVGYCLTQGQPLRLSPQIGLGTRIWSHELDVTDNGDMGRYGYTEKWATFYSILGLQAREALGPSQELIARIQYRVPFRNTETLDLSNVGGPSDISLTPGNAASIYADAGIRIGSLLLSIFMETQNSKESKLDEVYQRFSQPEVTSTMVGGKVAFVF